MSEEEINNMSDSRIEISLTSTGKVSYSVKAYGTPQEIDEKLKELLTIANKYKNMVEVVK